MSDISPSPESPQTLAAAVPPVLPLAPEPEPLTPEQQAAALQLKTRAWCAFVFAICASMLAVGMWLRPDPRGVETHTQLGLLPCGFYSATGIPCPTCGCTTSVTHFAHGQWISSFATQPFGFLVGLVATILVPLSAFGIVTGRWTGPSMFWLSWHWPKWVFGGIGWLLLSWVYKIWLVKHGG